jgi:hypothetical protein
MSKLDPHQEPSPGCGNVLVAPDLQRRRMGGFPALVATIQR